ncbi:hypothetical protein [Sorangium cellulosum]|uniref:MalT-like TPR region domain-containing protein n=1 Tax=Sorangium cellulosum So0157-2 TaxID=1254432 RepID=S4YAS3_SORCE|nr:hypothetical protein [Sorangium cellulosum]AGP41964.1 hypothetical protein SCE1572_50200 [Sorangium cellulosum So0157-2]
MDPITRASKAFLAEAEAFWRSGRGPLLPVVASPSERVEVAKTLRIQELAPENRRPLFLHEEPFLDPRAYFEGLARAISEGYELIRRGAEEEGVWLPIFAPDGRRAGEQAVLPLERAVLALERAATLLGERLDGVLLALLPGRVECGSGWRDSIAALQRTRFSKRVRIAVWSPPGGPLSGVLGEDGARFHVDADELVDFLKHLGAASSAGPAIQGPPLPTEEQQRALEAAAGRRLPSVGAAARLRAFLLGAGQKTASRDPLGAAEDYRRARELCRAEGLALEESMVLIALGGACLAANAVDLAIEGYRKAAELAEGREAWPVVCQAWLGAGGAYLTAKRYAPAAVAYRASASAATRGRIPLLQIEALRMAGTCSLLDGRREDAVAAWQEAVDAGAALDAPIRCASTFPQVASALVELLQRVGLRLQAAHVRSLLDAAGQPSADLHRVSAESDRSAAQGGRDVREPPPRAEPPPEREEGAALQDFEDLEPLETRTAPISRVPSGPVLPFRSTKQGPGAG